MDKITIKNKERWEELKHGMYFEDNYNINTFANEKEPKHYPCILVEHTDFYNDGMCSETKIIFIYKSDFE